MFFFSIFVKKNNTMELNGKLLRIEPIEQITEKFKKRRLIVEYAKNENYPQVIEFTLTQANVSLADNLNQGDEVKLFFDLKGRESILNGVKKVFNTLDIWRIEVVKKSIDFQESNSNDTAPKYNDDDPLPF